MARATESLGIRLPARVKISSAVTQGAAGAWRVRRDASGHVVHAITVRADLSRDAAGETIWHELAHALDFEQAVGPSVVDEMLAPFLKPSPMTVEAVRRYRDRQDVIRADDDYENWPTERDARAAQSFQYEIPVTKTIGAVALKPWRAPAVAS